jgi:hypothetical protein
LFSTLSPSHCLLSDLYVSAVLLLYDIVI